MPVRVPLTGLPPYTRVYWRVVATNAAGTKRSGDRHVRTRRAPTAIAATVSDALAYVGRHVTVSGRVDGAGIQGMTVALEQRTFPFPPRSPRSPRARGQHRRLPLPPRQALSRTRWRVVTRSTPAVTSAATAAGSARGSRRA